MSTPDRRYVAEAAARAREQFQLEQEQKRARRQATPEGDPAVQASLLGLIRAAEEELREAQRHAAKVRSAWPPSDQLAQSEMLLQRTMELIAAAEKRVDQGGATREELRNGWEVLGRLQHVRMGATERYQTGRSRGMYRQQGQR